MMACKNCKGSFSGKRIYMGSEGANGKVNDLFCSEECRQDYLEKFYKENRMAKKTPTKNELLMCTIVMIGVAIILVFDRQMLQDTNLIEKIPYYVLFFLYLIGATQVIREWVLYFKRKRRNRL